MSNGNDNGRRDGQALDRIIESRIITALARLATIIGIPFGLGLLSWAGLSLVDAKVELAKLAGRVDVLTQVTSDAYRQADATKDFRLRDLRLDVLNQGLGTIDQRVRALEDRKIQ